MSASGTGLSAKNGQTTECDNLAISGFKIDIFNKNIVMSFLSKILTASLIIYLYCAANCYAAQSKVCNPKQDSTELKITKHDQKSTICVNGRHYVLAYNYNNYQVSVTTTNPSSKVILERLNRKHDPTLVGGETHIRFLPINLQPYINHNKVLYISSKRTSGGNGGGQCGAGEEVLLNVLDIGSKTPKQLSSYLISSCAEGIELYDDTTGNSPEFYAFSVNEGRLEIKFRFYKYNEDQFNHSIATISKDFLKLEFTK